MAPLVQLLLSAGPTVIRLIGERFGDKGKDVAHKVATVVEAVQGKPPTEAAGDINTAVQGMSPDEMVVFSQMQIELARIAAEREKQALDHELGMYTQEQQTHRTEATEGTDFVKETRPRIARQSAAACFIYVLVFELIEAIGKLVDKTIAGADWEIATALLAPCLGYMGMRTLDAFSKWKTAPADLLHKIEGRR